MTFWIAGAAVVGAGVSAYASSNAADKQVEASNNATNTQLQAQREAIAFQQQQANIAQGNQQPWRDAGINALTQLQLSLRPGASAPSSIPVNAAGLSQGVYQWLQQDQQRTGVGQPLVGPWRQAGTAATVNPQTGFLLQNSTAFSKPNTAFTTPNTAFTKQNTAFTTKDSSFTTPNTAFSNPFRFEADPGYAFRQAEGMRGINNSAAARGGVLSGAALKAASKYNQDFASNEYGNAYNRYQTDETGKYNRYMQDNTTAHSKYMEDNTAAYNRYQTDNTGEYNRYMQTNTDAYNRYMQDNTGLYNRDVANQTSQFNRLASLAGIGQTAANQMSAQAMQTGQLVNNNLMATGNQIAQNQLGAGNAAASGQIGMANAFSGAIGQGVNMYQQNQLMNTLSNRGSGYNPQTVPGYGVQRNLSGYDAVANGGWGIE